MCLIRIIETTQKIAGMEKFFSDRGIDLDKYTNILLADEIPRWQDFLCRLDAPAYNYFRRAYKLYIKESNL